MDCPKGHSDRPYMNWFSTFDCRYYLNVCFDWPELSGLRPAELIVLSVNSDNLRVGNVKRNAHGSATPKPPRTVQKMPLKDLQVQGARVVQLFHSGLEKLPKSIRNIKAVAFKACGHTFRQSLDSNATLQSLEASNPELTPY